MFWSHHDIIFKFKKIRNKLSQKEKYVNLFWQFISYLFELENGVIMTPKHHSLLSLIFTNIIYIKNCQSEDIVLMKHQILRMYIRKCVAGSKQSYYFQLELKWIEILVCGLYYIFLLEINLDMEVIQQSLKQTKYSNCSVRNSQI